MLWTNSINVGMGIVTLYLQYTGEETYTPLRIPQLGVPYISISVSLNVLLTLMIVIRLVLYGRNIRAASGSLTGISGLYHRASTMLIESCAIFAVNSLLVVGALAAVVYNSAADPSVRMIGGFIVDIFYPILAEIQVRTFPQPQSPGQLSNATMDRTGDRSTAHHSAGRQRERVDGSYHHHWTHQFVQSQEPRGTDG